MVNGPNGESGPAAAKLAALDPALGPGPVPTLPQPMAGTIAKVASQKPNPAQFRFALWTGTGLGGSPGARAVCPAPMGLESGPGLVPTLPPLALGQLALA